MTISTGKKRKQRGLPRNFHKKRVVMRRWCDRAVQADANQWAATSRQRCRWAQACYEHLRRKGDGHNAALRKVANKWIRILCAVIRSSQPYDEERYTATLIAHGVPWALGLQEQAVEAA